MNLYRCWRFVWSFFFLLLFFILYSTSHFNCYVANTAHNSNAHNSIENGIKYIHLSLVKMANLLKLFLFFHFTWTAKLSIQWMWKVFYTLPKTHSATIFGHDLYYVILHVFFLRLFVRRVNIASPLNSTQLNRFNALFLKAFSFCLFSICFYNFLTFKMEQHLFTNTHRLVCIFIEWSVFEHQTNIFQNRNYVFKFYLRTSRYNHTVNVYIFSRTHTHSHQYHQRLRGEKKYWASK